MPGKVYPKIHPKRGLGDLGNEGWKISKSLEHKAEKDMLSYLAYRIVERIRLMKGCAVKNPKGRGGELELGLYISRDIKSD